ncbi:MAG: nicotinate-nucleotide diphosphorylase (carboxylating) [Deltaproteobacteria bacterium]|nr:nicotinate-nucleotide diphosphorylase (carboxylating) [Deltaproteobacteria bacterium]
MSDALPGLREVVARALDEDGAQDDVTTRTVVPGDAWGTGQILAREPLVVCGLPVMAEVFRQVDEAIVFEPLCEEGAACRGENQPVARLEGPLRGILAGERVALNFAQRLSGIASWTQRFVNQMTQGSAPDLQGPSAARLVDTRKTTPGLRALEKYAVRMGGGANHRFGLSDGVLIKDNHILAAGGVAEAVRRAKAGSHHLMRIEVEVESLEDALAAVAVGVDALLLDNFSVPQLREAVGVLRATKQDLVLEASGGVSLATVAQVAGTGVDLVSCGALTHQARSVDLSLELDPK